MAFIQIIDSPEFWCLDYRGSTVLKNDHTKFVDKSKTQNNMNLLEDGPDDFVRLSHNNKS